MRDLFFFLLLSQISVHFLQLLIDSDISFPAAIGFCSFTQVHLTFFLGEKKNPSNLSSHLKVRIQKGWELQAFATRYVQLALKTLPRRRHRVQCATSIKIYPNFKLDTFLHTQKAEDWLSALRTELQKVQEYNYVLYK